MRKKFKRHLRKTYKRYDTSRRDWLAEREKLAAHLADNADRHGRVTVIESGRDCDGVQYDGVRHSIAAHPLAFERLREQIGRGADGPFYLYVPARNELSQIRYWQRDTFAEQAGY